MKFHIDTIPVWDAYSQRECECPLCFLYNKNQDAYVEHFLGGSVMEPSTRIDVNKYGFCAKHYELLFAAQNRLGLALITYSHLLELIEVFNKQKEQHLHSLKRGAKFSMPSGRFFRKKSTHANGQLSLRVNSCLICSRLENTIQRYAYTILHMWKKEKEFPELFLSSKGFCLPHFILMLKTANENMSGSKLNDFIDKLYKLQGDSLEEIREDLYWFTQKFDYRNNDKPWKNSKDAVERILLKLQGI